MAPLDLVVVVAYFAATVGVGLWAARRQTTAGDYFLGARSLPAWAVLLSIVATETSALTVVSVPGVGARGNLTFLQLAFGYLIGRIAVAAWLLPGYFRGTQETAYQRLESRFGAPSRRVVSVVFLITRLLGDGVRTLAGAIPLAILTGWSVPVSIVVMGTITLLYTWFGGLKAVVWADVIQLVVYLAGGIAALVVAWKLAGGPAAALASADASGRLRMFDFSVNLTSTYTFIGGIIGGGLLSAASHGTDHLIVQRLLATRSLRDARVALIGSGVVVILQFLLFLLVGSAIWVAGFAPEGLNSNDIFSKFVVEQLPTGISGLVLAGILAAAMNSSINALASSMTHDLYASWTGRTDPVHLLRVGRVFTLVWGIAFIGAALLFHFYTTGNDTPAVVLALSIASITYGALLAAYILAGRWSRARGPHLIAAVSITMIIMLMVVFARPLSERGGFEWLEPVTRLAWPWYVPLGTLLAVSIGTVASLIFPMQETA